MHIKQVARISGNQDGAIWGKYLFRFDDQGFCSVYDLNDLRNIKGNDETLIPISTFTLDKSESIAPHSNAVMFGNEFLDPKDEFPLLYSNIYNNYANSEDPLKGVCCVYRLTKDENNFKTELVQLIEIGFVNDSTLWKSSENDVRPYGNFTIDREKNLYYAFVMRDKCNSTRYFSFNLPKANDGSIDEKFNVKKVTLMASDIIDYFDCDYHHFIQGACTHNGKIYSAEGFGNSSEEPPAIRVISLKDKKQEMYIRFADFGLINEPEFIDFKDDTCYYSDAHGNLHIIEF